MTSTQEAAKTPTAAAGEPIDIGYFAPIPGLPQWITLRGSNVVNPLLLIMPGPGAGMSTMAPFFAAWERDFTIVQWDQPRAGVTHAKHGAADNGPYTYDRLVRDGIAALECVSRKMGGRKIAVLALSGGSIIGLRVAKARPDLLSVYAGCGQIVNWARQDELSYRMVLAQQRAAGNDAGVAELEALGPPPYADASQDALKSKYSVAMTSAEQGAFFTLDPAILQSLQSPPPGVHYVPEGIVVPDVRTTAMAAYTALRPELIAFDAEKLGFDFHVPMIFLQGELDACTVSSEVQTYAARLRAPNIGAARPNLISIPGAGHSPWMMRDAFLQLLIEHVRPLAVPSKPQR